MSDDADSRQLLNQLPLGSLVGDFRITGVLGEGGFGVVYIAHDETLDRKVAVKEYLPSNIAGRTGSHSVVVRSQANAAAFEAGLKNFMREARMLARFSHPAIVEVYRVWEQNGTAYMAMRYIAGKTLRQCVHDGMQFDEAGIRQVLLPVFDALSLLHQQNVIHRDVSPDNIMLREDGSPVLLDLGSARLVVGGMTQALTTVLKPGYAPIEQYVDDGTMTQGPWTDVYGLGATLYYLLTGTPPPQSIARMINDPLQSIAEKSHVSVPPEVFDATLKALAVRAENRFQSIEDFRAALGWEYPQSRQLQTIHIGSTSSRTPGISTGQALPTRTTPAAPPRTAPSPPPAIIDPGLDEDKTLIVTPLRTQNPAQPARPVTAPATAAIPTARSFSATEEEMPATEILPPESPAPTPARPSAATAAKTATRLADTALHRPAHPPSSSKAPIAIGLGALLLIGGPIAWWLSTSSKTPAPAPTPTSSASAPAPAEPAPPAPSTKPTTAAPSTAPSSPPLAATSKPEPTPSKPPSPSDTASKPAADPTAAKKAEDEARVKREQEARLKREQEAAAKAAAEQRAREQAEAKAREEARQRQEAEQRAAAERAAAQKAEEERQHAAARKSTEGGLTVDIAAAQRAQQQSSPPTPAPVPAPAAPAPAPSARKSVNELSSEGINAFRRGDLVTARRAWNEIVSHPEATARSKATAYNNLAISYCQAGDLATCERHYVSMLRADPNYGAEVNERDTPPFSRAFERARRVVGY